MILVEKFVSIIISNIPCGIVECISISSIILNLKKSLYSFNPNSSCPAGNYIFKVNNRNTRTRCEICSKLTIKIPERWRRSGTFIVNFEHISHLVLVFLLITLSR